MKNVILFLICLTFMGGSCDPDPPEIGTFRQAKLYLYDAVGNGCHFNKNEGGEIHMVVYNTDDEAVYSRKYSYTDISGNFLEVDLPNSGYFAVEMTFIQSCSSCCGGRGCFAYGRPLFTAHFTDPDDQQATFGLQLRHTQCFCVCNHLE